MPLAPALTLGMKAQRGPGLFVCALLPAALTCCCQICAGAESKAPGSRWSAGRGGKKGKGQGLGW